MIILTIAAALSSMAPLADRQQVMGANSGDIYSAEYDNVTGGTRCIRLSECGTSVRSADTYKHVSIKPKKKLQLRLIPLAAASQKTNGLDAIIARVKREHNIKTKS